VSASGAVDRLPTHVAIVGVGLVGGSVALAAQRAGVERVSVYDADPGVRRRLGALGVGTDVAPTLAAAVQGADLVMIATPAPTVPAVVEAVAQVAAADALLTDAASLKLDLTLDVESRLRVSGADPRRFVGGHPMAGSERSGPEAADASLFQGATWVLTPSEATGDEALHGVSAFLQHLGARVLVLPADRHDELVALVSHLPQVVASTLADVAGTAVDTTGEAVLALAGGGFRDTTRIAASDPGLWLGILRGNRTAVLEALDRFRDRLEEVRAALASEDWAGLERVLAAGSAARRRLVSKGEELTVVDLVVALDDRPGALAAVTTALGEAGINIEDLAMRHAADVPRGALLLRIEVAAAARALDVVHGRGFAAHLEDVDPGAGSHG
jgi:prephenate dehydrogenase